MLLLRDVLGYRAAETAVVLGLTEKAVTSALKRARATMEASRPPAPHRRGTAAVHRFFTAVDAQRRGTDRRVPVRANGQPAWREYRRDPVTGVNHLAGIQVIALVGDRICEITRFETTVAPHFGLPRTLG